MERIRKVLLSLILIISIMVGVGIKVRAEDEKWTTLNVTYGYRGVIKPGTYLPIVSDIKNTKEEKKTLTLEVLSPNLGEGYNSYREEIEINGLEEKRIYTPVTIRRDGGKIKVKLYDKNSLINESEVFVPQVDSFQNDIVAGVLTEDIKKFEFLSSGNGSSKNDEMQKGAENNSQFTGIKLGEIRGDIFDSNIKNLDGANVVIANNFDFNKLSNIGKENLKLWIENGGILILGGSSVTTIPKEILNANISPYKNKWIGINEGVGVNLSLGDISGEGLFEGLKYGKNILSKRIERNAGSIIVLGFDIESKSFKEFEGRKSLFMELLRKDFLKIGKKDSVGSGYPWSVDEALNTMPYEKEFELNTVIVTLIIFILIVSYGGYFILKKIDRRELLWVIIPIASFVATVTIYNNSKGTRISDKIQIALNTVFIDEDGNGRTESYYSIGTNYKSNLTVKSTDGVKVEYIQNEIAKQADQYKVAVGEEKINSRTLYKNNDASYEFDNISALEFRKFKVSGKGGKYKKVDGSIKFNDFVINGKITNNMDVDTIESYLFCGDKLWLLGKLDKGESVDFSNREADFKGSIQEYVEYKYLYANNLKSDNKDGDFEGLEEYKNATRLKGLLDLAIKGINDKKPYIISVVNDYIDYGLDLNSDDIMKFSQSVYVNPISINLGEPNGDVVYPPGFINGTLIERSGSGYFDAEKGIYQNEGACVIDYSLSGQYENNFEVKEVKLYDQEVDEKLKNSGLALGNFKCKVEIFNFKTDKYEELKYNYGGITTIGNLKNYVLDGHMKIKYTNTIFEGGKLPLVSVRGKVKNVRN